ncbi:MAG TPA: hypothetical protein VF407_04905, partial [Polyangiaceae bacterium]
MKAFRFVSLGLLSLVLFDVRSAAADDAPISAAEVPEASENDVPRPPAPRPETQVAVKETVTFRGAVDRALAKNPDARRA